MKNYYLIKVILPLAILLVANVSTIASAVEGLSASARERYTAGLVEFKEASASPRNREVRYRKALDAFMASYEAQPHPYTAYYVAVCGAYLGDRSMARNYMNLALNGQPKLDVKFTGGANTLIRWANETVQGAYKLTGKADGVVSYDIPFPGMPTGSIAGGPVFNHVMRPVEAIRMESTRTVSPAASAASGAPRDNGTVYPVWFGTNPRLSD